MTLSPDTLPEGLVKAAVQRFLCWRLPDNFSPDAGISFNPVGNAGTEFEYRHTPHGTNLLDAVQAEAMVRHILEPLLTPSGTAEQEGK